MPREATLPGLGEFCGAIPKGQLPPLLHLGSPTLNRDRQSQSNSAPPPAPNYLTVHRWITAQQ